METLRSYIAGRWTQSGSAMVPLLDPSTEAVVAMLASGGIDFGEALEHAHREGGPALRELTFAQRGELLRSIGKTLRERRDEFLEISRINNGSTVGDGAFDIDGAGFAFAYYGKLAANLGEGRVVADGDGIQLAKTEGFWGQHVLAPRRGVAVHINAFNFPAWGFAEKAACAILAGMPVITKPATATAWLAARVVETIVEAGILPAGALQLVCGSTGDLLKRLGPQDVVAFTGSADTARSLRGQPEVVRANTRFNVEADSLNAAVLGPDALDGPTFDLFLRDVAREVTQKAGQKCTAVRRILAPAAALERVAAALVERLGSVVTGNPADENVTMGPLATARQLADAMAGIRRLEHAGGARIVLGEAARADGVGSPAGKGFFLKPTLFVAPDARAAEAVHRHEVFAPVATVVAYEGSPSDAADIVGLGGGMLVTSVYSNDDDWLARFLEAGGSHAGRLYVGTDGSAGDAPGSGVAMPQTLHGGPGRAGDGAELGGLLGVTLYLQRIALQGARADLERLAGG